MSINPSNPSKTIQSDNTMRRLVINTILIVLLAMVAFIVFGIAVDTQRNVTLILGAILVGALIFAIRGNSLPGQVLAPFGVMVALLYTAYNGDGLHDEILIGSPIVIVVAGMLLGNRGVIIFSILLAAGIAGIGLVEISGVELSISSALTAYDDIAVVSIMLMAIALVLRFLILRLNSSIIEARRNEESQILANQELRVLQSELEQRVTERTEQVNRRAIQLQASSEVGRAISSLSDLSELLDRVTTLISERFGYYHVGVFLLDQSGENAVLRASNSQGGRQMLEREHSLPVGSKSMVGFVTQYREPRIAMDVGRDATHFDNPDLPQTRSEITLPLIAGGSLLGALDVQSIEPAAFTKDDISVLQVLADQVAIAIENATLFAESHTALEVAKRAYGELSREAWSKLLGGRINYGYHSDSNGNVHPVEEGWSSELIRAKREGHTVAMDDKTLVVPFKILDLPAGIVKLKKPTADKKWTEREINLIESLVGNLGEALESARLYEDTRRRAERERIAADISARIRESLDVDTVLQTAVLEMRRALNLDEITIRLGESNGQKSS
jgi:GAF domain-containing protein